MPNKGSGGSIEKLKKVLNIKITFLAMERLFKEFQKCFQLFSNGSKNLVTKL